MQQQNCTIEKVEVLPGNIGYLKINFFPMLDVCREKVAAAMARLNNSSAVIFDLRDNTGGFPDTVAFIGSYLFDHPEYWYNPRENTTEHSWTQSPVAGNRLAYEPVYILTSSRTASGAEQFTFDLKMLKRATVVGEKTAGAAHAGVFHRLDDHFGLAFTEARPINPFATAGWQDTGIAPDVPVAPAEALTTAQKLAEAKISKK
jgi:C-terminal processing protease CtpA/Prc